jgi:hypothetical protein
MAEPTWTFAPNGEGEEHGFHNPGVETFKGNLERYLAREVIQNSLDAVNDTAKPVQVSFDLREIKAIDIPGIDELAAAFQRCADFWSKDKRAKEFFERAYQITQQDTIPCLRLRDSNTKGVAGEDSERDKGWYTLVRCSGASTKGGGEGGSFGLGKHATFAASRLRTVFYSTRTDNDDVAFQGVARLVTHDAGKVRRQPTGYLGGPGGRSLRKKGEIPSKFKRTDSGTDVNVLGYHADADWEEQFTFSVLENFWPAIHRGALTVTVSDLVIDSRSLPTLLQQYSTAHSDFTAHLFHRAYTEAAATATTLELPNLKEATVRLLVGDQNTPNQIAMVRNTGMVIYHRRVRGRVPCFGVFECRNPVGARLLRNMEPPRHDDWDGDLPEKGENRHLKREVDNFILDCVKALAPVSNEDTLAIPDLNKYLPDDGGTPEDGFEGPPAEGEGTVESFNRTPKAQKLPVSSSRPLPPTQRGGATSGDGDEGAGGSDSGDKGGEQNDGTGGDKGSEGGGGDGDGTAGGDDGCTPVQVQSRAFLRDPATGVYALTVHPPTPRPTGEVYLRVSAVGDDSLTSQVRIAAARLTTNNRRVAVHAPNRLGPVQFAKSGPLRLEVTLAAPRRLSLQVTADEVPDEDE